CGNGFLGFSFPVLLSLPAWAAVARGCWHSSLSLTRHLRFPLQQLLSFAHRRSPQLPLPCPRLRPRMSLLCKISKPDHPLSICHSAVRCFFSGNSGPASKLRTPRMPRRSLV